MEKVKTASDIIIHAFHNMADDKIGFYEAISAVTDDKVCAICNVSDCHFLALYLINAGETQPEYLSLLKKNGYDLYNVSLRHAYFPLTTLIYNFSSSLANHGKLEESLILFEVLEKVFNNLELELEAAKSLSNRASIYQSLGDLNTALRLIELAEPVYRKYNSQWLGSVLKEKETIKSKLNSSTLLDENKDIRLAQELYKEGGRLLLLNDFENAESKLIKCYNILKQHKKMEGAVTTCVVICMLYRKINKYNEAIKLIETNIIELEGSKEYRLLATLHSQLGDLQYLTSNYAAALSNFDKSISMFGIINEWKLAGSSYWEKGKCLNELSRYDEAIEELKTAKKIFEQNDMELEAAKVELTTALSYIGTLKKSNDVLTELTTNVLIRNLLDSSFKIFIKHDSLHDIGNYYLNSGNLEFHQYHIRGHYKDCVSDYLNAIEIFDSLKEKRMANIARLNLSRMYIELGLEDEANELLEEIEE